MNIQRYGIPVLVAAALHGSLFLIGPDAPVVTFTAAAKLRPLTPPPAEEQVAPPPAETDDPDTSPMAGPVKSPPMTPDVIEAVTPERIFTVPVEPYRPSLEPMTTLENFTGLPPGLETGPGRYGPSSIFGRDQLDRSPRAMVQNSPAYPDGLRREGIDGSVTVEFVVDPAGRVVKADAVRWSQREFVEPAVRAVLRWRFEPGTVGGRKVSFRMAVPIEFNATR